MAERNLRNLLRKVSGILIASLGLFYVVLSIDPSETWKIIQQAILPHILSSIFLLLAIYFLMGERWTEVLEEKGVHIGRWESFKQLLVSDFVNTFAPARAGDIYRGYMSSNSQRSSVETSLLVLKERLMDVTVITLMLALSVVLFFPSRDLFLIPLTSALFILGAFLGFKIVQKTEQFPLERLNPLYVKFREGLLDNFSSDSWMFFYILTSIIWLLGIFRTYLVFLALGIEISLAFTAIITFGWALVATLPLSPSGIGTTDALVFFILTQFGIGSNSTGAFIILNRVILQGTPLTLGGLLYTKSR